MATSCDLRYLPIAPNSRVTCSASSRVGTTMSACGRLRVASTFSRIGIARVWTGVGAMKPSSSIAREMSGWIASSPKRAVGGARVNVSPVLIYMLTGETLAVNDVFQRKAIQFGDDLFGIGLRAGSRLAGRRISQRDDRGDRGVRRSAEVIAHPVVLVRSDRVRAAAHSESPRRDHHVLGDASRV